MYNNWVTLGDGTFILEYGKQPALTARDYQEKKIKMWRITWLQVNTPICVVKLQFSSQANIKMRRILFVFATV